MKLREKLAGLQIAAAAAAVIIAAVISYQPLNQNHWKLIQKLYSEQLRQVDFALTNLIKESGYNIEVLTRNKKIKAVNPAALTDFTSSDEKTFEYSYSRAEKEIIEELENYMETRPHVNSAYVGFENGAFVRSHERARPTKYDPRLRPWYMAAKKNPGKITKTEPYRAVTTDDINIGIVKTITGNDGIIKGVLGADITLNGLSDFVAGTDIGKGSYIFITDRLGYIISYPEKEKRMKKFKEVYSGYKAEEDGVPARIKGGFLISHDSDNTGYTLFAFVPEAAVKREFSSVLMLFGLLFAVLIAVIVLMSWYFTAKAVEPLGVLAGSLRKAADAPSGITTVEVTYGGDDEISEIVREYNAMAMRLKQLFEELKKTTGDNERFLQISSHDLKELLRMISIYSQMMEKMCAEKDGEEKEISVLLGSAVEDLKDLLAVFTDYSRARGMEEKATIVEPGVLVADLAEEMAAGRSDVVIEVKGVLPVFRGVNAKMKYIFRALISNAIKFNESKVKNVIVKAVKKRGETVFSVQDNGIGIEEKYKDKIFRFSQKLHSRKEYPGFGMALCLAKEIVENHGGHMWYESQPEKGSTFYFSIPAV